jgi:purine-binding chemotaxis protein CheW
MDRKKKLVNALGTLFAKPEKEQAQAEHGEPAPTGNSTETISGAGQIPEKSGGEIKARRIHPKKATSVPVLEGIPPQSAELPKPEKIASTEEIKPEIKVSTGSPDKIESVNSQAVPIKEPQKMDQEPVLTTKGPSAPLATTSQPSTALAVKEGLVADDKKFLVFELAETYYAIDVSYVQTTIKPQPIYLVPGTVEFIKGLINLRGTVVPVVDLRARFGLPVKEQDKRTRFVVIEMTDLVASLVVDAVQGVETIKTSSIEPPPGVIMGVDTVFLKGVARIEGRLILLLNLEKTVRTKETSK